MSPRQSPLRVAFVLHSPSGGGAQRRTLDLAHALAELGVDARLVFVHGKGELADGLPKGLPVSLLAPRLASLPGRRLQCTAAVPSLARFLGRDKPDVVVAAANHIHLPVLAAHALARSSAKLVLRASNHLTGGGRGRPVEDWLKRRSVALYRRADAVVAVSDDIARQLARLAPRARVRTMPNPVVDSGFPARMAAPLRHPWLGSLSKPVILGCGRLEEQKDFPTLLRAAARIGARVILLGDGSQRRHLAELARALDVWLDMPGFVPDPLPWMAQCSVFCLSSAWEGMPGALIEAMACGRPVVATAAPGGAAEILENGRLGPLVPVGDDRAMADAITALLANPPSGNALRRKAAEYSVAAGAAAFLALITELSEPAATEE